MSAKKEVLIVGAGPGGLTAGMLLQHNGYNVSILEKADRVGGRNARIDLGNFKFDTGPTFLMMKFILDEMFDAVGRRTEDYLKTFKLDPMYKLYFPEFSLNIRTDLRDMKNDIAKLFPGEEDGIDKFLEVEEKRYKKLLPCLKIPYSKPQSMVSKHLLGALPILSLGKSLYGVLGDYFKSEKLRLSFTFQSKYLGMSPWDCPGAFTIIPHVEHREGIYHVMGGLSKISEAMAKVVKEDGGKIELNCPVKQLILDGKKVIGLLLEDGRKLFADAVFLNSDFAHTMHNLVPKGSLKKYSRSKLKTMKYSCSTFMLYLGINKKVDLPHHNIRFSPTYKENVSDIFARKVLHQDTAFYLHNPSAIDPSLAPEGKSSIYILVPVANNKSGINWERDKKAFRDQVLKLVAQTMPGLEDIEDCIEEELIITPQNWQNDYNVYMGATFNLAHSLDQMLYLRPRNKFEELGNCYLVGGGTHPGSGLPTIYESARISVNLLTGMNI
ncbi:MAG: phytoene desaturase family protein [Candidatus Cloacimonetes bacterium]|nr:phytoene desaturase family protein [Candidatus Cloacimonadota bacterium]